ncbi:glycosyltransferase [Bacillus sp. AFS055030]|uniref:glycosyltransferase n=1 Tax=Bacillus sp. AFS055030 TaxID=2033507 RepID=UPI000BFE77AC|nr:glycosyltransferase [Bacillus sp. AFS055030]PGL72701.1 glycosyl transferase family 1 [Bacillus sp. AFS055030]
MNYKNKKIIFVTGSLADGGAERVMSILATMCAEAGADVTLVVMREKKYIYHVSDKVNCIQIKTGSKKFKTISRIKQLRSILKKSDDSTVIPFLPLITLYTMIANMGINKRVITSERSDPRISFWAKNLSWKDRVGILIMRKMGLYNLAELMVFQTPDAQSYYNKNRQKRSCIIPNPLDTDKLPKRYEGEREKRIVAAGRFSEEKNFSLLIEAFSIFHKKHPEYNMTIYGEGALRNQLEREIKKYDLMSIIKLPGFASNLPEEINKAAMYVSTSNHEGISNSMLEALGMGIPSIVTDCPVGGARMFVKTDENGILIPMNDCDALVEAMSKIAEDRAYAEKISANATKIREEISAKNICKMWLELV